MSDLIEFVRAQLDEDERAALACAEVYPPPWDVSDRGHSALVRADEPGFPIVAELDQAAAVPGWLGERLEHIARHDPARVLAEVEAKRRIIERYERQHYHAPAIPDSTYPELRVEETGACRTCVTLRILALPYADRPGYREEWRP